MDVEGVYYCSKCMRGVEDDRDRCPHCGYEPESAAPDRRQLSEGTFLKERYLLGAVIGAGGFGVTYAAWDENLQVPVAIKEYFPVRYADRDTDESDEIMPREDSRGLFALGLDRFRREAYVLAQFRNVPGIVNINECFEENATAYIVMEFVRGVPLAAYVEEHRPSPRALLEMMRHPIDALETIHRQGVNHRDIKPENLLVQEDGTIKLIDFGSARETEHVTNLIVVSDGYAPVEQYDTKRAQGPWGDIYSLSATIYHLLTGEMPPISLSRTKNDPLKKPSELGVKLKKHQERALLGGLTVDPEKRIRSIGEFRAMLYNMPLPEEVRRRRAFMRRVFATAAAIILLIAAVLINSTIGFPLGSGLLYTFRADGLHVVGCTGAQTVIDVPASRLGLRVTTVAASVLSGHGALRQINIPGSVENVDFSHVSGQYDRMTICGEPGSAAEQEAQRSGLPFLEAGGYSYVLTEGGAELQQAAIAADGASDTCIIPSCVDGHPVVALGEGFVLPEGGNIVLPVHLTRMPPGLFDAAGGAALFSGIDPGRSLESIPANAFAFQTMESMELPGSVVSIGENAFLGASLRRIGLPGALREIGTGAFFNSKLRDVTFPAGLETIGERAFANTFIDMVDFPASIVSIGGEAFAGAQLRTVELTIAPDNLGAAAFSYCSSLVSATITGRPTEPDAPAILPEHLFANSGLYQVTLGGTIRTLGRGCFENNRNLNLVELPDGLESIGEGAFRGCASLTHISIPDSVEYIHPDAFAGCGAVRIIGSAGSYAQQYAAERGLPFSVEYDELTREEPGMIAALPEGVVVTEVMEAAGQNDPEAQYQLSLCYYWGDDVPRDDQLAYSWASAAAMQGNCGGQAVLGLLYVDGLGIPKNEANAASWFELSAEQGHVIAQYNLGALYSQGRGVPQSDEEAARWWLMAAGQGHVRAQSNIGIMYANGIGVPRDDQEAVRWYREAAGQGYAAAQNNLGYMYENARGVEKDTEKAIEWYLLAAKQGLVAAKYNLGVVYLKNRDAAGNAEAAAGWFREAAEQGHAKAQYNLGYMYANGLGVTRDDQEAVRWYMLAADKGVADAQYNLGRMYGNGRGVQADGEEACRWYMLAAEQGHVQAQHNLGVRYGKGDGVPHDEAEAAAWYRRAAEQGYAESQYALGTRYANGRGVAVSDEEAVRWWIRAAEQGHSGAQYNLGVVYAMGRGVPQDDAEAVRWLKLAAAQGHEMAQRCLAEVYPEALESAPGS